MEELNLHLLRITSCGENISLQHINFSKKYGQLSSKTFGCL